MIRQHAIAFDNLRGIAILLVMAYHFVVILGLPYMSYVLMWGLLGVKVFFLVSGFLIFSSFQRSLKKFDAKSKFGCWASYKDYAKNRLFRILPAYYFNLFMLLLLVPLFINYSPYVFSMAFLKNIIDNFFLISYLIDKNPGFGINGVYWTLTIEMLWYLLVPILFFIINNIQRGLFIILLSFLYLLALDLNYFDLYLQGYPVASRSAIEIWISFQLPGQLSFFTLGIILFLLHESGKLDVIEKFCDKIIRFKLMYWLFLFFSLWIVNKLHIDFYVIYNLELFLISAIIFLAMLFSRSRISTPLTWIGKISYSLYLWHLPVYMVLQKSKVLTILSVSTTFVISSLLVLILSFFSYYFIELAGIRMKSKG